MKASRKNLRNHEESSDDMDYEKDFEKLKTLWNETRKVYFLILIFFFLTGLGKNSLLCSYGPAFEIYQMIFYFEG